MHFQLWLPISSSLGFPSVSGSFAVSIFDIHYSALLHVYDDDVCPVFLRLELYGWMSSLSVKEKHSICNRLASKSFWSKKWRSLVVLTPKSYLRLILEHSVHVLLCIFNWNYFEVELCDFCPFYSILLTDLRAESEEKPAEI